MDEQQKKAHIEQKKARIEKWQQQESPFYKRWRVYSTFLTGFAIGLFYVLLISDRDFLWLRADEKSAMVLIFSGILGGVIYTIMVDGHVEMPEFIPNDTGKFRAGLFGDILLGIAGAVVLDFIAKSLEAPIDTYVEIAAAGIVGGYGGRAILQFALQRVFKDVNLLEADRIAYLQANMQQRLNRKDSLELIDLVNAQIRVGLAGDELSELKAEIEAADTDVRRRIFNLTRDFRLAAKAAGEQDRIVRMMPIFEALVTSDPEQHAYYAELAFAYKDSGSPDLFRAIEYLDKAIALRGDQHRAETWNYELSRAITRIQESYKTNGSYDFAPAVHERIIADLLAVAEIYNLENILKAVSDESMPRPIINWMRHNQKMLAAHPKAKALIEQLDSMVQEEPAPQPEVKLPSKPSSPPTDKVSPRPVAPDTPPDAVPKAGIELIKEFEGYAEELPDGRARAYADAIYGWEVPTIGYGTTRYPDGKKVQQGDIINREQAEKYLLAEIEHSCKQKLEAIPTWPQMNDNQRSALYSFAYNLGPSFYRGTNFDSITRVCDSPDKWLDQAWIEAQFIKYRDRGTPAEEGLRRRRLAEAELFCIPASKPSRQGIIKGKKQLAVRYFSQRDNSFHSSRTCNTTSCWMGALYMKPELWEKCNRDNNADFNYYYKFVEQHGDTTKPGPQTQALEDLGVTSQWRYDLSINDVKKEIDQGRPVVLGIYHNGYAANPTRDSGHMILAVGYDENSLIIHDPNGDLDVLNGGYHGPLHESGAYLHYSYKNLGPRFEADGPGSGWGRLFR